MKAVHHDKAQPQNPSASSGRPLPSADPPGTQPGELQEGKWRHSRLDADAAAAEEGVENGGEGGGSAAGREAALRWELEVVKRERD